jgi:hypothetical protein
MQHYLALFEPDVAAGGYHGTLARRRIDVFASIPFFAIHGAALLALWTGVTRTALAVCLFTYVVRMFGITAGFNPSVVSAGEQPQRSLGRSRRTRC